ncbi:MAG: hypothetical protein LBU32_26215, partial [Clostridiales bacterium]|nr:hypothetical protein [Clostridiales bacterium]
EAAGAREELGHWEIGSAVGKKSDKAAVPATVERKARSQIAAESGQVAGSFGEAAGALKSAAGDNGREFAGQGDAVERAVYFRHPYSSLEKGTSERHNGLLRRFAEKGGSAGGMPAALIAKAGLGTGGGFRSLYFRLGRGKNPYGICCI